MPRTSIATKTVLEDMTGVTIGFKEGEPLTVLLKELGKDIVKHLALHGLSQKLGDSYSGEKDIKVARTKAQNVAERLLAGDWRAVREGGGGGRITDLAQALARITGQEIEAATKVIENMDKDGKSELRAHPQIKVAMAEIAAERAKAALAEAKKSGDETALDPQALFG
jgi:hypothetical protein